MVINEKLKISYNSIRNYILALLIFDKNYKIDFAIGKTEEEAFENLQKSIKEYKDILDKRKEYRTTILEKDYQIIDNNITF